MIYENNSEKKDHTWYSQELTPILHRILDVSANKIQLHQIPNWPRDSLPKSPIVQKLALITIPILYPWWAKELEIETEQFGPYSPILAESFLELLDNEKCSVQKDELVVQPSTLEEIVCFPEITELLIQTLVTSSINPVLTQFENLELFSIISVEHEKFFRERGILRRMLSPTLKQQDIILNRVLDRMHEIPHFKAFIDERGLRYAQIYIDEAINWFYTAILRSFSSLNDENTRILS